MKKIFLFLALLPCFLKAQQAPFYLPWSPLGNTLGNNTSWLGSADNFSFAIRTNNTARLKFTSTGYVYNGGVGGDVDNTIFGNLAGGTTFSSTVEGTTLFGYNAGNAITTGIINTAFGAYAGQKLTTGNNNTLFGYGVLSAASNTSNLGNTIIGYNAGSGITTGNYNTILGASNSVGAVSNNIVLSDGQGNIKYRWDGTNNTITGPFIASSTGSIGTTFTVGTNETINGSLKFAQSQYSASSVSDIFRSMTTVDGVTIRNDNATFGLTIRNGTYKLQGYCDTTVSNPNAQWGVNSGGLALYSGGAQITLGANGNVGCNTNFTNTAFFVAHAGSTTYAPFRIPTGALVTNTANVVAGNIEFLTDRFYATTAATTTARYEFQTCLKGSATLDFASTAAGTVTDMTLTVTGAATTDAVTIAVPNGSMPVAGTYFGWVSAANVVSIRYANNALVTAYDPASGTFKAIVIKN